MKPLLRGLILLLAGLCFTVAQAAEADLVLVNGVIYTVDRALARVDALALQGDRIVAAGTRKEIEHWIGPNTRVVDLQSHFVMPGFNDAHVHLGSAGRDKLSVDLTGVRSLAEMQERIRASLADFAPGEWISGSGWDHSLWPKPRIPTRADLDAVSTEHPMLFGRVDGHSAVANSLALAKARITRDTPNPEGGDIVRDARGEPTGWLKEKAIGLVSRLIPAPTRAQRKRALELTLREAVENGVTSLQDNSAWEDFLVLAELKREGKLPVRITEWLSFDASLETLKAQREQGGTTDPWLKTGALKGVTDGSGGSHSAAMLAPFADEPGNRGILRYDPEQLKQMVIGRDQAGFQIALHAIGDRAIRVALDAFAAARAANPQRRNRRHKIEHAQFVHPDDAPRFAALRVIASMQPSHLLNDMRWAPDLLGPDRYAEAYPWNSMLKYSPAVAFGTDYSVEPLNPFRGLYAAVTREFEDGGPSGGWVPEEKISLEDAIRAYTWGSAVAEFEEQRKGTLAPGKFADLIVLSQDITGLPPRDILRTKVVLTMVGGKPVYGQWPPAAAGE
ncbi:MAG: amidohydrolase [Terriglobia bacterium]